MTKEPNTAVNQLPISMRRAEWERAMTELQAYPPEPFDICLDYLPPEYTWIPSTAVEFSKEGLLGIYQCGHLSFISLDQFISARDELVGYDPEPAPLPSAYRIDHDLRRYKLSRVVRDYPEFRQASLPPGRVHRDSYANRLAAGGSATR